MTNPQIPEKPAVRTLMGHWLRDLIISLGISVFFIIFLYQPVKVEGTSMLPGLEDQERIFINKFVYRWEAINRGDIVVFRYQIGRASCRERGQGRGVSAGVEEQ